MKKSRLVAGGGILLGVTWLLASGCGSSNDDNASPPTGMSSGGSGGQGNGSLLTPDQTNPGTGGMSTVNPLCGVGKLAGKCLPDDASACRGYVPPEPSGTGGESAGGASNGGAGGEGALGSGGAPAGGSNQNGSGEGGLGSDNGGAGGQAGEGGSPGSTPPGLASFSCQVTRVNNQPFRQCVAAGVGEANAPCFTASDCAPSFACVTDGDVGRCLPYCCDQNSACGSGTYCAVRALRKAPSDLSGAVPPDVPVCVPADDCSLEDPFPCPSGSACRCKSDTACMVVRSDGTTTCLEPGAGQQGDACPCAWNHVCSSLTNKCVKLCRTDPTKDDCGEQKCQASSELPQNFGVCVGPLK